MNCAQLTNDLLLDYADWELPPHERERVALHLERCSACLARRDDLEGMAGALRNDRSLPPAGLLEDLDAAVLGRVEARAELRGSRRRAVPWFSFAAGVAAALLLVVLGKIAFPGRTPPAPVAVETPPKAEIPPLPVVAPKPPDPVKPEPAPLPVPEPPAPTAVSGDLNGDGVADIADARMIQQIILQGLPAPAQADVNGDGTVDIADVRLIAWHEVAAR